MPPPQTPVEEHRGLTVAFICVIILFLAGFLLWEHRDSPYLSQFLGSKNPAPHSAGEQLISSATYTCDKGMTIQASYYDNPSAAAPVTPGLPPSPTGSVQLVLSDGRSLKLPQTISGSGVRYANSDESVVFWNRGNTAYVLEGQTQTYTGCITGSSAAGEENWNTFASSTMGVSIHYPPDYTVNAKYAYTLLGPGSAPIHGVKFLIPAAAWQGTNLSGHDTGISVEELPGQDTCSASAFLPGETIETNLTQKGVDYLVASTSDAGAGNFYEEDVYALKDSNPCTAVRYFIHSTNIGNYTPGTVQAYDRAALLQQFDHIRQSLVLGR